MNVLMGRYKMISKEVKDYFYGLYGKTTAPDRAVRPLWTTEPATDPHRCHPLPPASGAVGPVMATFREDQHLGHLGLQVLRRRGRQRDDRPSRRRRDGRNGASSPASRRCPDRAGERAPPVGRARTRRGALPAAGHCRGLFPRRALRRCRWRPAAVPRRPCVPSGSVALQAVYASSGAAATRARIPFLN